MFVGGQATTISVVILHCCTSFWHCLFLMFSGLNKICQSCIGFAWDMVVDGVHMLVLALANYLTICGMLDTIQATKHAKNHHSNNQLAMKLSILRHYLAKDFPLYGVKIVGCVNA